MTMEALPMLAVVLPMPMDVFALEELERTFTSLSLEAQEPAMEEGGFMDGFAMHTLRKTQTGPEIMKFTLL